MCSQVFSTVNLALRSVQSLPDFLRRKATGVISEETSFNLLIPVIPSLVPSVILAFSQSVSQSSVSRIISIPNLP